MSDSSHVSWIKWYCSLPGNGFLCEIDEEYISDRFNLAGLNTCVPKFRKALSIILDEEDSDKSNDESSGEIEENAAILYGLIHARYILTTDGIEKMIDKWNNCDFGKCPNLFCQKQYCLPIGLHSKFGISPVKLYCPCCNNIYNPRSQHNIDGSFIGCDFPQMLFMNYPDLRPKQNTKKYESKLFGFKIHPSALL